MVNTRLVFTHTHLSPHHHHHPAKSPLVRPKSLFPPLAGSHPSARARLPLALAPAEFSVEMRRGPNGLSGAVMICKVSGDGGLTAGSKHRKPMNPQSVWARTHSSAGRAARRCEERYVCCVGLRPGAVNAYRWTQEVYSVDLFYERL